MALGPDDFSPVASGYATPQQLAAARSMAAALIKPKEGQMMQSWTQPAGQIANALVGAKLMQQSNQRDNALTQGLGTPLTPPGPGPGPQATTAPTGDDYADASNYVKHFEGFDPVAKWDFKQWTNGYGTRAQRPYEPITQEEAQKRFDAEFGPVYNKVSQQFPNAGPQQKAALSSVAYNAGSGVLQGTPLAKAAAAGDWNTAAQHMLQYNHAGGQVNPVLVQRRQSDARMLLQGPQPGQKTASGGPVQTDAAPPGGVPAGVSVAGPTSGNAPQGAGSPATAPNAPPQQTAQAAPAPNTPAAAPQSPSGGPQFQEYIPRGAIRIPPEIPQSQITAMYSTRNPELMALAAKYQEQNRTRGMPMNMEYQGGHLVIPDPINRPDQQLFIRNAPQIQTGEAGGAKGPIGASYVDDKGQVHMQDIIQDQPQGGAQPPAGGPQGAAPSAPGGGSSPPQGVPGMSVGQGGGMPHDLMGLTRLATDLKGREALAGEQGKAIAGYQQDAADAKGQVGQLASIKELGDKVGYGYGPYIKQWLGSHGVDTEGLTDIQAYQSAIDYMAPQLRPVGSGRLMQSELQQFKQALGGLMTTPEGRRISLNNLQILGNYKVAIGKIANDESLSIAERTKRIGEMRPPHLRTSSTLRPGDWEDGYRYKGGDQGDPNSWEQADY